MSLHRRTHRRTTLLTLYALLLSLAVVMWGAEYKMEQYPQRGLAFRVISPAKLLTEKERPAGSHSMEAVLASASQRLRPIASPGWLAPVSDLQADLPPGRELPAAVASAAGDNAEFTYFSFRPPPARILS